MTNTEKKPRITKSMRFEDIKALLNGESVTYGTSVEDAVAVLDHELELLAKKNSSDGDKKQTKAQIENEGYKEQILEFLTGVDGGVTCSQILKGIPAFADFSNQKVSALMRQLKVANRVTSYEEKGKTLFKLA